MPNFVSAIGNPQITNGSSASSGIAYATNNALLEDSLGNLYYVTMAQLGTGDATTQPSLIIYKSTNAGLTWSTIVSDSNRGSDKGFGASMVSDVITMCIVDSLVAPNNHLGIYQYNTTTATFLADDYAGPAPNPASISLAQTSLSDGTIVMAYVSTTNGGLTLDVKLVNWKAGVWGSPVDIGNGAVDTYQMEPQWLIKEKTTERVHLFLSDAAQGTNGAGIWHISQEVGGALNTLQQPVQVNSPLWSSLGYGRLGAPAIYGNDTQILIPYIAGPPNMGALNVASLRVLRATPAANPVWTDELAVSNTAIPNTEIAVQNGSAFFACFAIAQTGMIALVFAEQNQMTATPTMSQPWLYAVSTTALSGGWGSPAILFTGPFPAIMSSSYGLALSGNSFGVVAGSIALNSGPIPYSALRLSFIGASAPAPVVKKCLLATIQSLGGGGN